MLSVAWLSTPPTRPPSVLSSKLLKMQIIYFSWLWVIGWFWDALACWSSTLTRVKCWCEKQGTENMQGNGCKTGGELGNLKLQLPSAVKQRRANFLPRFASGFVAHFTLQVSFSGWSRIGLRSVDGAGRWRTGNSLCGVYQRWLLCWAGTAFCLHVGMHMISSSARRWHLNNV